MKVNIYDFDGTIYDGDATVDFLIFLIRKKPSLVLLNMKAPYYVVKWKLGKIKTKEFKEILFSSFTKFKDIDSLVEEFWLKNEKKLKSFYKVNKNDIISSASPEFLLKPICKKLKVKDLFATNVDPKTGKIIGKNNKGQVKVDNLYNKYPNCIVDKMYSDSMVDKPLLDLAKNAYIVKKNTITTYDKYNIKKKGQVKEIYNKYKEIINYLIAGACTVFVNIVTYALLKKLLKFGLYFSNTMAWIAAVIFAFIANKYFVFNTKNNELREFLKFTSSRILTLIIELALMALLVETLQFNDMVSKVIVQIIVIITNYVLSKLIVFNKKI